MKKGLYTELDNAIVLVGSTMTHVYGFHSCSIGIQLRIIFKIFPPIENILPDEQDQGGLHFFRKCLRKVFIDFNDFKNQFRFLVFHFSQSISQFNQFENYVPAKNVLFFLKRKMKRYFTETL